MNYIHLKKIISQLKKKIELKYSNVNLRSKKNEEIVVLQLIKANDSLVNNSNDVNNTNLIEKSSNNINLHNEKKRNISKFKKKKLFI